MDPPLAPDVDGFAPPVGLPRCGAGSGAGSGLTTAAPPATCFLSSAGGGAGPATNASGRLDCRPLLRGVTASASPPSFPPLAPAEALPPLDCLSATDGGRRRASLEPARVACDRGSAISIYVVSERDRVGRVRETRRDEGRAKARSRRGIEG